MGHYSNLRMAELIAGVLSWKLPRCYLPRALKPRYPSVYLIDMDTAEQSRQHFIVRDSNTGRFICEVKKYREPNEEYLYEWLVYPVPFDKRDWTDRQGFEQDKLYSDLADLLADITDGCYDHVLP